MADLDMFLGDGLRYPRLTADKSSDPAKEVMCPHNVFLAKAFYNCMTISSCIGKHLGLSSFIARHVVR